MEHKKRVIYLDALRVLAILCVLFNHSGDSGYFWFTLTEEVPVQIVSIFVSSFSKIGVPLFFMISGALLLGKDESLKDLYVKRVLKFVIILIVFSTIRYFHMVYSGFISFEIQDLIKRTTTGQMMTSYWFLYSYIAFLVSLPILRRMAKAFTDSEYIYLLFLYIIPCGVFGILARTLVGQIAIAVPFAADVIVYPLMGYYFAHRLTTEKNTLKHVLLWCGFALLGLGLNVFVTEYDHHLFLDWNEGGLTLFIILPALATFFAAKYFFEHVHLPVWLEKFICALGGSTFGMYLLEPYVKEYTGPYIQLLLGWLPRLAGNLTYIFCIMLVGCFITWILKHIPIIRKLL